MLSESHIHFTRTTEGSGIFSWPTIIYTLASETSRREIGTLRIRMNKAVYTSAASGEELRLRRNFWHTAWLEEGDIGKRFVKISIGFKHTATFADDTRYRMTVKRRWNLFRKKAADEFSHRAVFYREETEVAVLENRRELPAFGQDYTSPMEGIITGTLREERTLVGLLLLFQAYLTTSNSTTFTGH